MPQTVADSPAAIANVFDVLIFLFTKSLLLKHLPAINQSCRSDNPAHGGDP